MVQQRAINVFGCSPRRSSRLRLATLACFLIVAHPALASVTTTPVTAPSAGLSVTARAEILNRLATAMDGYVDPLVARKVKAMLAAQRPAYEAIADRELLARTLSTDLMASSNDLHLKVAVVTTGGATELSPEEQARLEGRLAHGLMSIRRLPANIGYLKLRYFAPGRDGEALVDAAMLMLKDSDALIIDLRENTGGGGASDERLLGHLSRAPIPMAMIRWRQPDGTWKVEQRRASASPGGPLFADKPVFVLTARRTFSAAEGFALDLKASGRAVLVGETTRGGANPGHARSLGHGLDAFVPSGIVTHPLTKGNWNGKGVEPDVAVPAGDALTEAYRRALAVAKPTVMTPKSIDERKKAIADPRAVLVADQPL